VRAALLAVPLSIIPARSSAQTAAALTPPVTEADVHFITGMIAHHAQAVLIAGWAPSHGASASLQRMCERIVVGQRDEIALMQQWLKDQGQPVPPGEMQSMHAAHGGEMMPGMLTMDQLMALDEARGTDFDRLFLTYMIQHHQGAITMVERLVASPGAAQDRFVFKLSSDINADQTIEIERMNGMLAAIPSPSAGS
jgi:uncharacterized protein (DUF305 family)